MTRSAGMWFGGFVVVAVLMVRGEGWSADSMISTSHAVLTLAHAAMVIQTDKGEIRVMLADGHVEIDPGVEVNEAARVFWDAIGQVAADRRFQCP